MESRVYDRKMSAKELLDQIKSEGAIRTDIENIVAAQDVVGRSTGAELSSLANDEKYHNILFHLLQNIWNWEDFVSFWNREVNPEHKRLEDAERNCRNYEEAIKLHQKNLEIMENNQNILLGERAELEKSVEALTSDVEKKDLEIMKLKAKLYDMMMKEKEQ